MAAADGTLRLLQVSAFFAGHGGGIEAVADQLARRLAVQGFEVRWLAGGAAAEAPGDLPPGLTCERAASCDPIERTLGLPFPLWGPRSVAKLWRAVGWADVVQVHDYLYMPTLLALLFAALRRRPVLLTQHIGDIPFRSRAARALLRALNRSVGALALHRAEQVVFVGRPVMVEFEAHVRFRRPPLLLPNGVDHERYRPAQRTTSPVPVELLFVGRFVEKKGLPLLRAATRLDGARWTFIGWGPIGPATWSDEERAGHRLLGRLPAAEIVPHYQRADLLVLPSTGEGFPLVLQEALACGTPVLVSTEVFEAFPSSDPRCVFHVELRGTEPAKALRRRLAELVAQPALLAAARPHAAALARQWSWVECVARYAALHRELAHDKG